MPPSLMGRRPILLTTDAVGGVWTYSLDLATGLAARGVPVVLATMGPPATPAQKAQAEAVDGLHLVHTGLPLDWTAPDPAALTHASQRLAALAALCGAASTHLHAPALVGTATWPTPTVAVAHSDVGTWWAAMRDGPPPADFAWRIEATGTGLRNAAAIIAPTKAHAQAVQAIYGDVPITTVHNGSSPLPEREGTGVGHAPSAQSGPVILTAARLWDEAKNLAAIDAAAEGLPIAAAGPTQGPNGETIVLPNLHLLGTLTPEQMTRAYSQARIYVSMARYEPFGLSILEAANAGCRLVLSDIPAFRELWDGAATFATPATLAGTLRHALARAGDGGARERAGRYTLDRTVDATLAVHAALGAHP